MCNTEECNHQQKSLLTTPLIKKFSGGADEPAAAALAEARSILRLAFPMAATGLLLYLRSMVSMLFLGRLGRLPLAGGALAIGFANITGYSVLSGLAMGMEPVCGQAFGARRHALLRSALRRTVLLLLLASVPIAALWLAMHRTLLLFRQDPDITAAAHSYILASLPDLLLQSFLHPLRIYLRTQSITLPLTAAAAAALLLHLPVNYLLVSVLGLGIRGVAVASVVANSNLLIFLLLYVYFSGIFRRTDDDGSGDDETKAAERFGEWRSLLNLAIPSCISVCLEWWWYEIMILLCGLLLDPKSAVASMGILIQTTSLVYIFPSSLSFGVSTRVSNELGADRPERARRAAEVGLSCGAAIGVAALGFTLAVRKVWGRMFTEDAAILELTTAALLMVGMAELGNCPQTAGCGVLRGSARPRAAANVNMGAFYGVGMPVAIGLAFWGGLDFRGMWFGMLAAQAACAAMMLAAVRRTDWTMQAERAQRLTGGGNGGAVKMINSDSDGDGNGAVCDKDRTVRSATEEGDEKTNVDVVLVVNC
ncbi:protein DETOXIFICATION 49-like [Ananas comosus]|uniref:Protein DETOXIFICATION n=1 Tax=Ananas comosus TaxID=4615 RepID=A0A6P5EFQ2_ANACO|nr:protein DETOXIFICATION 49-like [Ananas comosus]